MDEITSLRSQLKKLRENLLKIEDQKASFIDPRSIPPDLEKAERTTRKKIIRVEARLAELEPDQSRGEPIDIPFVIVAMTRQEASALVDETVFDSPQIALAQHTRFQEFKEVFQEEEIEDWPSHYTEDRGDWSPHACPESTISEIVIDVVASINQLRRGVLALPLVRPQFRSADFFAKDENTQEETWRELAESGCVLVIDAVSLFHPYVHQTLSESQLGSKDQVAMLILSPISPSAFEANQLVEREIRSRMRRAFARFDRHLDKLCEVGVGDLRAMRRWLFAVLPEAANIVQKQRFNPSNRRIIREQLGEPLGMERVVFGQRGGR